MFLVDRQTVPATLRDAPPTRLKLRVRADGQIIELADGKTTIGSSPRCNLRLDRPGVEPLHCLLMDGPEGLRVRRWATDTRLNGEPVDEAPLEAGDCLALGGVELELVGPVAALELVEERIAELVAEQAAEDESHEHLWGASVAQLLLTGPIDVAPTVEVLVEDNIDSDREGDAEDVLRSVEFAANETDTVDVAAISEHARQELLPASDAAELVFRELQSACAVARGRNRKMLAALRNLRAEKETLARRLENDEPSKEFAQDLASWDAARERADQEQRELHVELKELRQQLGEWESRLAEHGQQMAELQQELVATRASEHSIVGMHVRAKEVKSVALFDASPLVEAPSDSQSAAENGVVAGGAWESLPIDSTASFSSVAAEQDAPELIDVVCAEEQPVSPAQERVVSEEAQPAAAFGAESVDPWDVPTEGKVDWTAPAMPSSQDDAADHPWDETATGGNSNAADAGEDDLSPFAEFSIWKQGVASDQTSFEDSATSGKAEPAAEAVASWGGGSFGEPAGSNAAEPETENPFVPAEEANPWAVNKKAPAADASAELAHEIEPPAAPAQPSSFIERYSHLFGEEAKSAAEEKVAPSVSQPAKAAPLPLVGLAGKASAPATGSEDEESIEQYMAKLMKRVRGDSPIVVASQVPPTAPPARNESCVVAEVSISPEPVAQKEEPSSGTEPANSEAEHAEVAVNWDAFVQRAATAPATNMGALRALANETARRDISRHQLKRHRRDTKTKVIISTLAGMTSLWLMLDAGNWRSLQFITACISLLVAAWWAGEAFREMLRSMRVTYVGPGADEVDAALPIDVEG